jgi:hypothetical protein
MKTKAKIYLHASKESNYDTGKKLRLSKQALEQFRYACHEVEIELEVDRKTGESKIIGVDGRKLR